MEKYEIFYEDEYKVGLRKFDEEFKMWIESYIPKNKNNYDDLNSTIKTMFMNTIKACP